MTGLDSDQTLEFTYTRVDPSLFWRATAAAGKVKTKRPARHWLIAFLVWLALVAVTVAVLRIAGRDSLPVFGIGIVVGAAVMIGALQFQRFGFGSVLEKEQADRGPVTVRACAEDITFKSSFGVTRLLWRAVDDVIDLQGGTGLRCGLMVYPIPDDCLPADMTPAAFRETLTAWRTAA